MKRLKWFWKLSFLGTRMGAVTQKDEWTSKVQNHVLNAFGYLTDQALWTLFLAKVWSFLSLANNISRLNENVWSRDGTYFRWLYICYSALRCWCYEIAERCNAKELYGLDLKYVRQFDQKSEIAYCGRKWDYISDCYFIWCYFIWVHLCSFEVYLISKDVMSSLAAPDQATLLPFFKDADGWSVVESDVIELDEM